MDRKSFFEKITSFGMGHCLKSYKEKKQDRDRARKVLENGGDFITIDRYFNGEGRLIDLRSKNIVFFLVFLIAFITTFYTVIYLYDLLSINKIFAVIIVLGSPMIASSLFGKLQCRFLLNEFTKIDEIDALEDKRLREKKQKIAACNLYLK